MARAQNGEREFFGADYHPGDYVFTFEDGRPPHPDTIRQRFDRLAAAAGLSRITFHDLRHSYATGALKAGVSPKVLSERIGHADVGFFLQTYAHVLKNDDRDAAEQAASFLIGDGWVGDEANQMMSKANVHKSVHKRHENGPRRQSPGAVSAGSGDRIRTCDLWVMSPASYRAAPPRVGKRKVTEGPVLLPNHVSKQRTMLVVPRRFERQLISVSTCSTIRHPSLELLGG